MFDGAGNRRTFQPGDMITLITRDNGLQLVMASSQGGVSRLNWSWDGENNRGDNNFSVCFAEGESDFDNFAKAIAAACGLSLRKADSYKHPTWIFI